MQWLTIYGKLIKMVDNSGIPITAQTISETINKSLIELSLKYAEMYEVNPKNFVVCFMKFKSIRMVCESIVSSYVQVGAMKDCKGDFLEWVNKQPIEERWKPVLNDTLKIIYSLTK